MKKSIIPAVVLLTAALILPAAGIAADREEGKKKAANPKPVVTSPSECRVQKKVKSPGADTKRKQVVADREADGKLAGPRIDYHADAAKHQREKAH